MCYILRLVIDWKDIDIYYVGYVDKKLDWNVNSVNPLYLLFNRVYGYVSEKIGNKFLTIDKEDSVLKKYDQVFFGIKHDIKKLMMVKIIIVLTMTKLKF